MHRHCFPLLIQNPRQSVRRPLVQFHLLIEWLHPLVSLSCSVLTLWWWSWW